MFASLAFAERDAKRDCYALSVHTPCNAARAGKWQFDKPIVAPV